MNCQTFENLIDDVARGRLMDAAQREDALAHSAACSPCAARLEDERALTAGLRTLAACDSAAQAPARVEAALLVAFRERREAEAPQSLPVTLASPASPRTARAAGWWLPRWAQGAAVAAASMLLVVGLYGVLHSSDTTPGEQANNAAPPEQQSAGVRPEVNTPSPSEVQSRDVAATVDETLSGSFSDEHAAPSRRANRRAGVRRASRGPAGRGFDRGGVQVADASYTQPEITTDYIPLMNGGRLTPGDAGHVMRVEVPRAALASFGLPVNADRAEARVKADVLVGEDGIARAIRFVR